MPERVLLVEDRESLRGLLSRALTAGRFEDGLTQALEEVSAVLVSNFPESADTAGPNELPDSPVLN